MKLTTEHGQLDLPRDFALTMERTNPLLSDQGDFSVPATLPSSKKNLAALGHRERLDRAEKYINKVDAILEVGPVRKRGQLVVDTVHRTDGIDSSFAIDNSDLYSKAKKKTLKEIFADYSVEFENPREAAAQMQGVFEGRDADYMIFPVAIAPYEVDDGHNNKTTVYQYNNKVDADGNLVWEAPTVHEGDIDNMSVPDCYGLAPFLRLSRLVELLFQLLGYEVTSNCLNDWPFQRMVMVHNCSDCLCNPTYTLYYRDLVPSCTLSDFLTWLNNKWHVQPVVDSETRHVKIVAMETMLTLDADLDITQLVEGDFKMQLNPAKRIVLTPSNKIEGTDPAADTFDKLIEKYGNFDYVNELEFQQYPSANPPTNASLILRRATGQFYAVEYDSNIAKYQTKLLGTNHFTYDRQNSDDTEDFSQNDSIPLMLVGSKMETTPFIGDRLHAHTSYNGSTADDKQDIIVVQAVTDSHFVYQTTGTTQPVIPYAQPQDGKYFFELGIGVCPYDLYEPCWQRYNNLLLNHPTHMSGRVDYSIGQILAMDMTRLKHCLGQKLLPVTASATIGPKPVLTEAEFLLVKSFIDGIEDTAIVPTSQTNLVWEITDDIMTVLQALWTSMGGGLNFGDIDVPDMTFGVASHWIEYGSYSVQYLGDNLQPGIPEQIGEVKHLTRQANITIYFREIIEWQPEYTPQMQQFEGSELFTNVTVTFTFTAVQH